MEASITFKSVAKKIKNDTLLAELTFGVEKNTIFSIVGPNGSGKSVILKLICGLLYKDKGSIYVKGYDVDTKIDDNVNLVNTYIFETINPAISTNKNNMDTLMKDTNDTDGNNTLKKLDNKINSN